MGKKVKDDSRILNANKPFLIIICVLFFLYSFTLIFPFLWLINNSVKAKMDFLNNPMSLMSFGKLHFENYLVMFTTFNLPKMFFNTLAMCLILPTVSIFMSNMAAYAVAKCRFIGKKTCYFLAMVNIFVHISGTLPVLYKLMTDLGLIDSLFGIVIMGAGGLNFQFLIFHGIYSNISREYKEAAEIDGAGRFRIFLQIYFPQVIPTSLSFWLLGFIGQWNNYATPYLFWPSQQTISTGIKYISDNITAGPFAMEYPKLFAAMIITIIPVILLFIVFQKPINNRDLGGGIKG